MTVSVDARPRSRAALRFTAVRVALFAVSAVGSAFVARVFGPARFGVLAAAGAVVDVVLVLGFLGLDQLYLSGAYDDDALRRRTPDVAALSAILVVLAAALWPGLPPGARPCALLLGLAVVADQLRSPWMLEPQRRLDVGTQARRESVVRVAVMAAGVGAAIAWRTPFAMAAATLLTSAALVAPAWRRRADRPDGRGAGSGRIVTLRRGFPYAASGALYSLYFQIDMALLATMGTARDVGLYRAAYSFVVAAAVLPVALNNDIMRPRVYRVLAEGRSPWRDASSFARITAAFGALATVGLLAFGGVAVRLLFGPSFAGAVPLLHILALALFAHYANSWLGNLLVALGRVREVLAVQGTLVLGNVLGNLWMIPRHGAAGAATMTVASEVLGMLGYLVLVARRRTATS